jgi:hypothetical protein
MRNFADDTNILGVVLNSGSSSLKECVDHNVDWSNTNFLQLNLIKCKEIIIRFKRHSQSFDSVLINDQPLEKVEVAVTIRNDLKWNDHVEFITAKAAKRLYLLSQLKRADACILYCIRSILEYACQVFHCSLPKYLSEEIERIHKRAMSIIFPDISYGDTIYRHPSHFFENLIGHIGCASSKYRKI